MVSLKRLVTVRTIIFFTGILLLAHLAQIAFAQDTPTEEPTVAEATTTGTPTDIPTATEMATEVPVTAEATEISPTEVPTDVTPVQPTQIPPPLPLPDVRLVSDGNPVAVNGMLTVSVQAANLSGVYGAALLCLVDTNYLQGTQAIVGDLFTPEQLTILDNGFQPDGQWAIIASQGDKAPELAATGTLWTLNYQITAAGATTLTCQIQLADRIGQPLPITSNILTLAVESYQPVTLPDAATTAVPLPDVVVPTAELPTAIPAIIVTAAPTPIPTFHLQGYIATPYPLPEVTITLNSAQGQQSVRLASDSSFSFDLPSGIYQLTITVPYHLTYLTTVTLAGQPILLPLITLQNGDIDSSGHIDTADAGFIIQNFGLTANASNAAADLNRDGIINIYDLTILSANIRS